MNIIPFEDDDVVQKHDSGTDTCAHIHYMQATVEMPYQIHMSSDPFEDITQVSIDTKGDHKTLGLIFKINEGMGHRPQLQECLKSTPAAKIPKWKSNYCGAFPTDIDGHSFVTEHDFIKEVQTAQEQCKQIIMCKLSIINRIAIHLQQGVPILYNDQLNIIATHIAEI